MIAHHLDKIADALDAEIKNLEADIAKWSLALRRAGHADTDRAVVKTLRIIVRALRDVAAEAP